MQINKKLLGGGMCLIPTLLFSCSATTTNIRYEYYSYENQNIIRTNELQLDQIIDNEIGFYIETKNLKDYREIIVGEHEKYYSSEKGNKYLLKIHKTENDSLKILRLDLTIYNLNTVVQNIDYLTIEGFLFKNNDDITEKYLPHYSAYQIAIIQWTLDNPSYSPEMYDEISNKLWNENFKTLEKKNPMFTIKFPIFIYGPTL